MLSLLYRTDDLKKGVYPLVQTARSIWEYQNALRKQQQMKNVFAKNPLRTTQQPEKQGAIDDISAILIILNNKIDKNSLLQHDSTKM
jgi:hypothetical protein